jgi:hypothetical protein
MFRKLINQYAQARELTPFYVMGEVSHYYLKVEVPVNDWCQVEGFYVDVKGKTDRIKVLDGLGFWYALNPNLEMDLQIAAKLYNQIRNLQTA